MRDPNRIPEILSQLESVWEQYPDLRFTQLVVNVMQAYKNDLYYMEDNSFIKVLKDFYSVDN